MENRPTTVTEHTSFEMVELSSSARLSDGYHDTICGIADILVLPHSQHSPPGGGQDAVSVSIPCSSSVHFCGPVASVRLGDREVLRAPVPEAAVDEDRDFLAWKDDIGSPAYAFDRGSVDEVAQASTVQLRPQLQLGTRIPTPVRLHRLPHSGRRRPRVRHDPMIPLARAPR